MAANKVVFGNKVLIDLTGDTVTEEALLKGYTFEDLICTDGIASKIDKDIPPHK